MLSASGEARDGRENGRIAALIPAPLREPAPRPPGTVVLMIAHDQENPLAYCHEELQRPAARGHGPAVRRALRDAARAEAEVHRDVSLAVLDHMGRILGRPRPNSALLAAGIRAVHVHERLAGRRRTVSLRLPERRDALGGPAAAAPGPV